MVTRLSTRPVAFIARAARAVSSDASTSAPQTSVLTHAARAFVAAVTLYACDSAVDDFILLSIARELARERSTVDDDPRIRAALGASYAYDGEWWNAAVSRPRRSGVARVTYALAGASASCDVTVTMVEARDDDGGDASETMKKNVYRLIPPSVAHAVRWTSGWRAYAVDCSLPTARGGGRSALVSLMRDDDATGGGGATGSSSSSAAAAAAR